MNEFVCCMIQCASLEFECFPSQQVHSIHLAQTRWMLDFMLLMVPDHSEDHSQEQEHHYITTISLQTLVEDAKTLAEKLDVSSAYISRYNKY